MVIISAMPPVNDGDCHEAPDKRAVQVSDRIT